MNEDRRNQYSKLYETILVPTAAELEKLLKSHLEQTRRIDRIVARAKTVDRFEAKAAKIDDSGKAKYESPLIQIQDQIGARVVVYYKNDLEPVEKELRKYLFAIEEKTLIPDSEWKFGYFGRHFIMKLPTEAVPKDIDSNAVPNFFELQIKTLFQHAWSEAEHDLGYKPPEELSEEHQRNLAYTSAQAWGADEVFERLAAELVTTLKVL
jgi:ppGpp synthetase/RelA/SpoT-type nucleotidyltranferase